MRNNLCFIKSPRIQSSFIATVKLTWASQVAQSQRIHLLMQETQVGSLGQKIPWRRKWQLTPVFLPGEFHGQRSLTGCSPWGRERVRHNLATKQQHPWSKDLIRSRGKLWTVSIFSINLLSPAPPCTLETWLACNFHPSCSFIYYQLSHLLFTIKGFPSQGCMQFDIVIALKEANVNGGGSTISWWVEWDVWTGI